MRESFKPDCSLEVDKKTKSTQDEELNVRKILVEHAHGLLLQLLTNHPTNVDETWKRTWKFIIVRVCKKQASVKGFK